MNTELATVKSFFASMDLRLSELWLESCINWCKSEVLTRNYTVQNLQSKVYEQWLLLDLRDIEAPCLPPNLSSQTHSTLTGNFCLQLMQVVDISKPKLWQLQKIRNSHVLTRGTQQESDVVGTGKRMLQLSLTDGVQTVEAVEYRPVSCLNLNLTPGLKIRLLGPVTVRRGRLMLEPRHVKILGGEVEELLVTNHAENVLARSLRLPQNPTPGQIEEKAVEEKGDEPVVNRVAQRRPPEDEEMEISREIDLLLEAEEDLNQPPAKRRKSPSFDEEDFEKLDELYFTQLDNAVKPQTPKEDLGKLDASTQNFDDEEDDVFNDIDLDEIEKKSEVVTIAKLLENGSGSFRIKAKFKCVIEKLTISEDEYKVIIKIEDATSDLTVKLHSDIIADFTGYAPAAILSLKANILEKDEAAVDKVMKAMQNVKDKLLKLDNVMVVEMKNEEIPVIVKIDY